MRWTRLQILMNRVIMNRVRSCVSRNETNRKQTERIFSKCQRWKIEKLKNWKIVSRWMLISMLVKFTYINNSKWRKIRKISSIEYLVPIKRKILNSDHLQYWRRRHEPTNQLTNDDAPFDLGNGNEIKIIAKNKIDLRYCYIYQ